MTREEAIDLLDNLIGMVEDNHNSDYDTALQMGIKALEQEPCDDCISRDMALEKMADYVASGYADSAKDFEEYSRIICQLPPVTPKSESVTEFADRCRECGARYGKMIKQKSGKWIPVSEPPKELGTYLIQTDGEPYMCQCRWTDVNPFWTYLKTKPHWNIFDLPQYSKVIAWMPLPEPYEPQESEKDACKDCYYNDGEVHAECVICDKAESEDKE